MRDDINKSKVFTRRALILWVLKSTLFLVILGRYFYLQVIDSLKYKMLSDKNRVKLLIIPPIRGKILDRNGSDIATNILSYRLLIDSTDREAIKSVLSSLSLILGEKPYLDEQKIAKRLEKAMKATPFLVTDQLTLEDVAKIEVHSPGLEHIIIDQGQRRSYTHSHVAAHITGYISAPSKRDIERLSVPNLHDFQVGKNGIEKTLDEKLRGYPGVKKAEVDAYGKHIREISHQPPREGETINLSIDMRLQAYAAELLKEKQGCVVLLDVKSGEVLALYSSPSYDPNVFVGGVSAKDWKQISSDPGTPLINKAIAATYSPGSTFKIVTALAGLEYGIPHDFRVLCNGEHKVGDRIFHCPRPHGNVDIKLALARSCNIYFYTVAEKVGIKGIISTARRLGFGSKTGVELPFESQGNIPDPSWKLLRFSQRWTVGDTVNASIGQGFILATPLQIALMSARLASGIEVFPTVLHSPEKPKNKQLLFLRDHLRLVRNGVFMTINDPRGASYRHMVNIDDFQIAGKTGTAQIVSMRKARKAEHIEHGLFTGFAPYHDPKYAIATLVEHGSWGSSSALPIAKQILLRAHMLGV